MLNDPTKRLIKSPPGGKKLIEVDKKLITKLRSVLKNGKGKVTPGDYQATPIQCIEAAVREKTLENLETGLWFCYFKSPDGVVPIKYALVFLFHYGDDDASLRILHTLQYIEVNLPDAFGWVYEGSNSEKKEKEIFDVLPDNISRTFQFGENSITAKRPFVLLVRVRKIERCVQLDLEDLQQQQIELERRIRGEEDD